MNQIVPTIKTRLPIPQGVKDIDAGKWRVLCDSVFPNARSSDAILLAMDYCRVRNLDIFKKPVNIVPMWSTAKSEYVETVWEGINSIQVTATRTGSWAGMDEPKWGADVTRRFKGTKKNNVGDTEVEITYPESCSVTVYRIVHGEKYAFTETVYWLEAYARIGKTELPNDMWAKRPRGQLHKCAKAASLRSAFPEEASYTSEEMEGRVLEEVEGAAGVTITEPVQAKSIFKNASLRNAFCNDLKLSFEKGETEQEINDVLQGWLPKIEEMKAGANEHDLLAVDSIRTHYDIALKRVKRIFIPKEGSEADIKAMQGFSVEPEEEKTEEQQENI